VDVESDLAGIPADKAFLRFTILLDWAISMTIIKRAVTLTEAQRERNIFPMIDRQTGATRHVMGD
jgi:hypothetical protein